LAAEEDPLRLLERYCSAARELIGAKAAIVGLMDEDGQTVSHCYGSGLDAVATERLATLSSAFSLLRALLTEGRPCRISAAGELSAGEFAAAFPPFQSWLGVPLKFNGQAYGWLCLFNKVGADEFEDADEQLAVSLAGQMAAAYQNVRLYSELQRRAAELATASRLKDEFLATLSHELRTPLNAILGWTSLLRGNRLEPAMAPQALETIERNARAQARLVEDLLDVSRIIVGNLQLNVAQLDLVDVIASALESAWPAAEAKQIRLETDLDPAAGAVQGEAGRLQQVVWNLLSNAIKFTPPGGNVLVRLERVNSYAHLSISDTGEGISPAFLPHVFDRFRQQDSSTRRRHGGLGLGLGIARHLVEQHGGSISAHSAGEGKGATFIIQLPLTSKATSLDVPPGKMENNDSFNLSGIRCLIVEDNTDARELLAFLLVSQQAEVKTAASAGEALDVFSTWQPDLLIADIGLPDEDGYAFIRKVRQLPQGANTPAISLTGFASAKDEKHALAAGFQVQLPKPIEPDQLNEAVVSLLKRQRKE
jgi:signal transduction histidine kinase/CheY-like chemotaxis protein